jgi:GT2 family glycosyltransferase
MIEFAAFNHAREVAPEFRWEHPFLLFESRLFGSASVLDASGDASGLREPLLSLYPKIRHCGWNPAEPPTGTFDRILAPRIDSRIGELSRLLKPGGLLAATWRPGELSFDRLAEECRKCDLFPLGHEKSCGAVFYKAPAPELPAGRKIVLSLLTWNTRDISMESLAALVRESEMLKRLGQDPFIVVCDNGSTDGTAEALRAEDEALNVPHRFLFNDRNCGSSLARNRILDVMRDTGGDFLLCMDGDIEIVPFSSFAMLRHLEDAHPQAGCVGAHCHSQTRERQEAAPYLFSVPAGSVADDRNGLWVAWTQYGLFRREVFDSGVRFDESGPFAHAGWGCEDVDLAFQMHNRGFYNQAFTGIVYLHRNLNSSIPLLRELGLDPRRDFHLRREYVIQKWQGALLGQATLDFLSCTQPQF